MTRQESGAESLDELIAASGLPRATARALLAHACGRPREWILAHAPSPCPSAARATFEALAARARAGEPLAYLLGGREFHGLWLTVGPDVLIPRPETELLVDWVARNAPADATVADLGTGSGAIAIAIARERPDLTVWATDVSAGALAIARRNAARTGARVRFARGVWWGALPGTGVAEIVVSNPPYVAEGDPHLERDGLPYEPRLALVGGRDGLAAFRAILGGLPRRRLRPGATLLFEHGHDQSAAVGALLEAAGLHQGFVLHDDQGLTRASGARLPHAAPAHQQPLPRPGFD